MAILSLIQQRARMRSELSRRIGYTNGLHDIYRFARVVRYLHEISPAPIPALRAIILDREPVQGPKYTDGVIDVARALGLVHKSGTNLTLSDNGYALYAVQQIDRSTEAVRALLLHSVLETDGDASLNLLDLVAAGVDSDSVGKVLVQRLLRILELRTAWTEENIDAKVVRDITLQELADSKQRLAAAVDVTRKRASSWSAYREERTLTVEQRIERFYRHTVNPRRGWLKDLKCIHEEGHQCYVTNAGQQILAAVRAASCYSDSVVVPPLSLEVSELLGVTSSEGTKDLLWRAVASSFGHPAQPVHLSPDELIQSLVQIFPHVKFHVFNEAAIESIYGTLAAQLATSGHYVGRDLFDNYLDATLAKFPDKIYRLRQRHGRTGYITMKSSLR